MSKYVICHSGRKGMKWSPEALAKRRRQWGVRSKPIERKVAPNDTGTLVLPLADAKIGSNHTESGKVYYSRALKRLSKKPSGEGIMGSSVDRVTKSVRDSKRIQATIGPGPAKPKQGLSTSKTIGSELSKVKYKRNTASSEKKQGLTLPILNGKPKKAKLGRFFKEPRAVNYHPEESVDSKKWTPRRSNLVGQKVEREVNPRKKGRRNVYHHWKNTQ